MLSIEALDVKRLEWFSGHPEITPLDVVAILSRMCQLTLSQLFRHSRKPIESEVATAAALFFHKFYLRESPLQFNPRSVTIACMNLACKTEEFHAVSLADLVNALPDANDLKSQVPKIEMRLLAALEYDLIVQQPSLVQLYWVDRLKETSHGESVYLKVYDLSCDLIRVWQWTDAVLVFSFPKLASAAVLRACRAVDDQLVSASEDESDSLFQTILRIMTDELPMVDDLGTLLDEVERVAYRFGKFDKLLKDPEIEQTRGFQQLQSLLEPGERDQAEAI